MLAQAGNRAGKTQPCMQMGEHGLEVLVTSGSMNVHNSAFFSSVPFPFPCAQLPYVRM